MRCVSGANVCNSGAPRYPRGGWVRSGQYAQLVKKYWLVLFGGALTIPDIVQDIFWLLNSD